MRQLLVVAVLAGFVLDHASAGGSLRVLGLNPMQIDAKQSLFGIPRFSGSIQGRLVYDPDHDHNGCVPYPPVTEPGSTNPFSGPFIMLVDRGDCSFVIKVRDAQNAGAAAVIVANSVPGEDGLFMSDDGSGSDITVPSMFISKENGDILKGLLSTAAPTAAPVMISMQWTMPHPDDHVEWSLWTDSADLSAKAFKSTFGRVSEALGNSSGFEPHYIMIDGLQHGCDGFLNDGVSMRCGNQCTNQGRYCAEDPDGDLLHGISGMAVVEENLRQMCIFKHCNATHHTIKFWNYISEFGRNCGNTSDTFNLECSERIQREAGLEPSTTAACVSTSGGTEFHGGENQMLYAEIEIRMQKRIWHMPSLMINKEAYRGALDCPEPISLATCPVLSAICAGLPDENRPSACSETYCWKELDVCGVCGGDGSSCRGCDGVPNSGKELDSCGKCGGDGSMDDCGMCFPASSPLRNKACQGCDGVPNSGVKQDPCGLCGGDGSFDKCGRCFPKADVKRQDDFCRDDRAVDIVQVTLHLEGMDKGQFYEHQKDFQMAFAEALSAGMVDTFITMDDLSVEDVADDRRASGGIYVRLHIRTADQNGHTMVTALKEGAFPAALQVKLTARGVTFSAVSVAEPKVVKVAGQSSGDDKIGAIPRNVFIVVVSLASVMCLVLTPLTVIGLRKWWAYRDLLAQYEQLKGQAEGNDFPELDMEGASTEISSPSNTLNLPGAPEGHSSM